MGFNSGFKGLKVKRYISRNILALSIVTIPGGARAPLPYTQHVYWTLLTRHLNVLTEMYVHDILCLTIIRRYNLNSGCNVSIKFS